jgi:hypothetical protein
VSKIKINGSELIEGSVQHVMTAEIADDVLRKMNHAEWLEQFSTVLSIQPTGRTNPMTPFRVGAISRLQLANRYIKLLESEARMNARKYEELDKLHRDAMVAIRRLKGERDAGPAKGEPEPTA